MESQGCTSFRIPSLEFTTEGLMDCLGHPMGPMGARKRQQGLTMVLIGFDRHQSFERMFGADVGLGVVNQGQDLPIVLGHKSTAQTEFSSWNPIADAGTGGAAVLLSPWTRGRPTPVALVIAGLAIGAGRRFSKFAVEPIGIGLMALSQALAAGGMLTWGMGCLPAHGNLRCMSLVRQVQAS